MLRNIRSFLDSKIWIPALLTRLSIGWMFARGGWGKLHNLPQVTEYFTSLHLPQPHLFAPMIGGLELICGGFIIIGLLTRFASLSLIAVMIGAIVTAKMEEIGGLADLFGTSEFLLALGLVWLVFVGPGCLAADVKLKMEKGSVH